MSFRAANSETAPTSLGAMPVSADLLQEAIRFLDRDFVQSFNEKRRHEDAAWDICKFAFTVHSSIVALSIAAYQFTMDKKINLLPAARSLLGMGLTIGLFFVFLLVRNRVYFVIVTRYINEHRQFFLAAQPLGFPNASRFFANPSEPPYFSWRSTQTWATFCVAVLNSAVAGALSFLCLASTPWGVWVSLLIAAVALTLQVVWVRAYLRSREKKPSASAVAFGATTATDRT